MGPPFSGFLDGPSGAQEIDQPTDRNDHPETDKAVDEHGRQGHGVAKTGAHESESQGSFHHTDPADICLVACHVWDTIGALSAGWQAALILRPWNAPLEVGPQPSYVGNDLDAIAEQLIHAGTTREP